MPRFDPINDIPNLAGKVCLVTGGSSGLGEATIAALAQHRPQKLYLAARSRLKAEAALARIKASSAVAQSASIEILEMDLASFDSIKSAAALITNEASRLDLIHLNAGVAMIPPALTKDGYEVQFGTNFLGHALLTQLLMPILHATAAIPGADVRVVSVSSVAHRKIYPQEGILFGQLRTNMVETGGAALYGQASLAKIIMARELAKRYPKITFTSLHPGGVKSNIYSGAKDANWFFLNCFLRPYVAIMGMTNEAGAKTQLWCSFSKDVLNGSYYEPIGTIGKDSDLARDSVLASKLWDWTEHELVAQGAPGWPPA